MMQGKVDVSFKIKGSKGTVATAYFTSIRRSPHSPFEVLRFLVVPEEHQGVEGQINSSPISLLGDGYEQESSRKPRGVVTVHDDQGELSLKRL